MNAYISGIQYLAKDETLDQQHAANHFCESLFGDPKVPINKLYRQVDITQMRTLEIRPSDCIEPVMKGMAAGEQRFIALKVQTRKEQARYFDDSSFGRDELILLHEGRTPEGLPNRIWNVKFSKSFFKDRENGEFLEPAKIAMLLTTGLYTHYEDDYLYQVRLDGTD